MADIYVVEAGSDDVQRLIALLARTGVDFYGLFGPADTVLVKVSWQWDARGRTNSDLLSRLIATIIGQPGWTGEVVVADNGQGQASTGPEQAASNAEDTSLSIQDVVNQYASQGVSTYVWDSIRTRQVGEYSGGDQQDGYVLGPETFALSMPVSYPKFTTSFGTRISYRRGVWDGASYWPLRVIHVSMLKSHRTHGVTCCLKHNMGVVSEGEFGQGGLTRTHNQIDLGAMGSLMGIVRLPDLFLVDAIYVNPYPPKTPDDWRTGPLTGYSEAVKTNKILAGFDPCALSYIASKTILLPEATRVSPDARGVDPDYVGQPLGQYQAAAYGTWLRTTKDVLIARGIPSTVDPSQIVVHTEGPTRALTVSSFPSGASFRTS